MKRIPGGILAAGGFQAGAVHCGLRTASRTPDIAVITSEKRCASAAVFTTNKVKAAPVIWSMKQMQHGRIRAIVVNSSNANACTGKRGLRDAETMAATTAAALGLDKQQVFVSSTGVIGHFLHMSNIRSGIAFAVSSLSSSKRSAHNVARAIMTTDTVPKEIAFSGKIAGATVRLGGIAKGSGMIAPSMATMLSFITTDVSITAPLLRRALRTAASESFNRITVDGHNSTNDCVVVFSNGVAGNRKISNRGADFDKFLNLLKAACTDLARKIVKDAEGGTKFVRIIVKGARSNADAERAARAIAESPLVKCAIHGEDPNWGRIISAVGYSGATMKAETTTVKIGKAILFSNGSPRQPEAKVLRRAMSSKEVDILVTLGVGSSVAEVWTCDLSKEYVAINADYHT